MSDPPSAIAGQLARRSMADRERVAADEVRRLLDAGLEVLATSPAARVGDIVRVSGLSNSAFYRYFASKDELIAAILRDGSERLTAYLEHQMAKADEPVEQVEAWITGVLDQARNERLAAPTRALLVQSRRLGGGGQGETMAGAADALRAPLLARSRRWVEPILSATPCSSPRASWRSCCASSRPSDPCRTAPSSTLARSIAPPCPPDAERGAGADPDPREVGIHARAEWCEMLSYSCIDLISRNSSKPCWPYSRP